MFFKYQHGGNLSGAAREFGQSEQNFLDFSANINPLGPSPQVWQAISDNLWRIVHYPDPQCLELKQALAEYLQIEPANLVLGNGGAELIYVLPTILPETEALILTPTFGEYAHSWRAANKKITYKPLEQGLENISGSKQIIYICNPNNPDGRLHPASELRQVLAKAQAQSSWVFVDESFIDLIDQPEQYSLIKEINQHPNLIILYSLTKFFALPGLRLGALIAAPTLIQKLENRLDPWRINALAQAAALAALKDRQHQKASRQLVQKERHFLQQELAKFPQIQNISGSANFLLLEFPQFSRSELENLMLKLAQKGVLVRDCANFYGLEGSYIRIAVRNHAENQQFLDILQICLSN
ncbi:MAG: threonine-phosphate decarboxylase CobD [Clostridia bacterium]|nr:threonine-phosphate decarboxylase CobD [Clostridia bacterium]